MTKVNILFFCLLAFFAACDGGGGPKGQITVTVNLDSTLVGYPTAEATLEGLSREDVAYWEYPMVGGEGLFDATEGLGELGTGYGDQAEDANEIIDEIGNKHVYVYLYEAMGDTSKTLPVLYKGENSDIASAIRVVTINKVQPGSYYVVAFYNYCGGDKLTNRLNRYDRYVIYNSTDPDPIRQHAEALEITGETPAEITMSIEPDWILGKPKWEHLSSQGRIFLVETDPMPTPDQPTP